MALREAQGAQIPEGATRLALHFFAQHHLTNEASVIAVRDQTGGWSVDMVSEARGGLVAAPRTVDPPRQWRLSERDGRRLDARLGDRCFYTEPDHYLDARRTGVGATAVTLELDMPAHHRRAEQIGPWRGLTGEVISLVMEGSQSPCPRSG